MTKKKRKIWEKVVMGAVIGGAVGSVVGGTVGNIKNEKLKKKKLIKVKKKKGLFSFFSFRKKIVKKLPNEKR